MPQFNNHHRGCFPSTDRGVGWGGCVLFLLIPILKGGERPFSQSNIFNFRRFYLTYPKIQTVSGFFSWSHIVYEENRQKFRSKSDDIYLVSAI